MSLAVWSLMLLSCCSAVRSVGARYPGPHGYSPDLATLEASIHRVAGEATYLKQRMNMLESRKSELNGAQDDVQDIDVEILTNATREQQNRIEAIKDTLKAYYHRVGVVEGRLAAMVAVSARLKDRIPFLHQQIVQAQDSNILQDAELVQISTIASQAERKLVEKLTGNREERVEEVEAIQIDTSSLQTLIDHRTCFSAVVEVDMDEATAQGTMDSAFPANFFSGNIPTVLCGIQGVVNRRTHPGKSLPYSYGDTERLALTVDCKAFADKVRVTAFDQSTEAKGYGTQNEVLFVYVQVQACSYSGQVSF